MGPQSWHGVPVHHKLVMAFQQMLLQLLWIRFVYGDFVDLETNLFRALQLAGERTGKLRRPKTSREG